MPIILQEKRLRVNLSIFFKFFFNFMIVFFLTEWHLIKFKHHQLLKKLLNLYLPYLSLLNTSVSFWVFNFVLSCYCCLTNQQCSLAWSVLLLTTIFVIIAVKMLWNYEMQHSDSAKNFDCCDDKFLC